MTSRINQNGHAFYYGSRFIGNIGTTFLRGYTNIRAISFQLEDKNSYMSWSYRKNPTDTSLTLSMYYSPIAQGSLEEGFVFSTNILINTNSTLELYRLKGREAGNSNPHSLLYTRGYFTNHGGTYIRADDGNRVGSGLHMAPSQISIFVDDPNKKA